MELRQKQKETQEKLEKIQNDLIETAKKIKIETKIPFNTNDYPGEFKYKIMQAYCPVTLADMRTLLEVLPNNTPMNEMTPE